jgi:hypothetical protein
MVWQVLLALERAVETDSVTELLVRRESVAARVVVFVSASAVRCIVPLLNV